ncbi:diaminopimelate epimerase [Catalinimonas alkaloidigena]|uniref:Diaminopimelate epimerase n=1 Tax=Catalinimonas alkaloidigena TaxID=1075417 RepID=A0A1G9DFM1_9BACT|nr:diaminopimelate epimerase [Catalinimonas alkaloidigena]SDK62669.1 diaminopimelate epimerase [Catalinimonas alkaloidigena]
MLLRFHKYHGTGNDFIMVDDRNQSVKLSQAMIARLCNRHFGIGADGLILVRNHPEYDFEMVYHNADGGVGTMCGNGGRCTVAFAHALGIIGTKTRFLAADGPHEAEIREGLVYLHMQAVEGIDRAADHVFLDTGSPHYVKWVDNLAAYDVVGEGKAIRYDERFAPGGGTNVNFVERAPDGAVQVRTYERGVEDETLSCGTGVTAVALSSGLPSPVRISTRGGNLRVAFEQIDGSNHFQNIQLIGPAQTVFTGEVDLKQL